MSKMIEMLIFSNFFSFFILYHLNLQLNFEARKKVAWHFTETFANAFVVCMGHIYTICMVPSERHEMKLKLASKQLWQRALILPWASLKQMAVMQTMIEVSFISNFVMISVVPQLKRFIANGIDRVGPKVVKLPLHYRTLGDIWYGC